MEREEKKQNRLSNLAGCRDGQLHDDSFPIAGAVVSQVKFRLVASREPLVAIQSSLHRETVSSCFYLFSELLRDLVFSGSVKSLETNEEVFTHIVSTSHHLAWMLYVSLSGKLQNRVMSNSKWSQADTVAAKSTKRRVERMILEIRNWYERVQQMPLVEFVAVWWSDQG